MLDALWTKQESNINMGFQAMQGQVQIQCIGSQGINY